MHPSKAFDSHTYGWHWRRLGLNTDVYIGRAGLAEVTAVDLYLEDGSLLASVNQDGADNPHVKLQLWQNYAINVPLGNGQYDNQQRFKIRVKTCFKVVRYELSKRRTRRRR